MSSSTPSSTPVGIWQPPTIEEMQAMLPQYQFIALLGRGGMGAVYKAVQVSLEREVAIKVLPGDLIDDADVNFTERFKNEARTMAKMKHPAIVDVYDFGQTQTGLLYFVMEFIDGTDVSKMIIQQGKLPPEHALAITAHVCDALGYAHSRGVIHRDIKPANILIDMEGRVKVADFGLAKQSDPGVSGLTKTNMAMGTPDFVAPEALIAGFPLDGRADLYAIGVMLYQMLTGNIPRGLWTMPSIMVQTDPRFDTIITKAMQTDREQRYQSATEVRRDLDVILTVPMAKPEEAKKAAPSAQQSARPSGEPGKAQAAGAAHAQRAGRADATPGLRAVQPKSKLGPIIGIAATLIIGGALFFIMGGKKAPEPQADAGGSTTASTSVAPTKSVAPSPTTSSAPSTPASPPPKPSVATAPPSAPSTTTTSGTLPTVALTFAGHRYQAVTDPGNWLDANKKAEAMGGHLAVITSAAENDWIRTTFIDQLEDGKMLWIGATNSGPDGKWKWVTGEEIGFTGWVPKALLTQSSIGAGYIRNMTNAEVTNVTGWALWRSDDAVSARNKGFIVEWDDGGAPAMTTIASSTNASARDLFDGRSFTGWTGPDGAEPSATWKIANGELVSMSKTQLTALTTKESFTDFDLEFEWRVGPGSGGDVFYHVGGPELAGRRLAYRIHLCDPAIRQGTADNNYSGSLYGLVLASRDASRPVGQWNTARVVVRGSQREHWVNGEKVCAYDTANPDFQKQAAAAGGVQYGKLTSGFIALNAHRGELAFRNVRVTADGGAAPIPPPQPASGTGTRDLFNGRDASGWTGPGGAPAAGSWRVDGTTFTPTTDRTTLWSEESFGDFEFEIEWKVGARGNGGIFYHVPGANELEAGEMQLADPANAGGGGKSGALYGILAEKRDASKPVGEWNTAKVVARGPQREHWINGELVCSYDVSSAEFRRLVAASANRTKPNFTQNSGKFVLQAYGGGMTYRNARIRTAGGGAVVAVAPTPAAVSSTTPPSASSAADPFGESPSRLLLYPDWLRAARAKGGRLRVIGKGLDGANINLGSTAGFDDFITVTICGRGWAARRRGGDTYAVAWKTDGTPNLIGPYPTTHLARVDFLSMRLTDGSYRNVWSGTSQQRTDLAHPDAVAFGAVNGHLIALGRGGELLKVANWRDTVPSPPQDFFLGATALTGTDQHYIAARPGLPVRSSTADGKVTDFAEPKEEVVEMEGTGDAVILLTKSGKVFVTAPDGGKFNGPTAAVPAAASPAVRVRIGRDVAAAQRTDGSWVAWGSQPDLAAQVAQLKSVVELDIANSKFGGYAIYVEAAQPFPQGPAAVMAAVASQGGDARLVQLETAFKTEYVAKAQQTYDASVAALNTSYVGALGRARAAAQSKGVLAEVTALDDELKRIQNNQGVPAADEASAPASLTTLRKTYRATLATHAATRDKAAAPVYDAYLKALDDYIKELTRADKLDNAQRVKAIRDDVAKQKP